MDKRKCQAIDAGGKECGLDLETESAPSELVSRYRCALGHSTHIVADKQPNNPPGGKIRDRKKSQ